MKHFYFMIAPQKPQSHRFVLLDGVWERRGISVFFVFVNLLVHITTIYILTSGCAEVSCTKVGNFVLLYSKACPRHLELSLIPRCLPVKVP